MTTKIDGTLGITFPDSTTQATAGVLSTSQAIAKAWVNFNCSTGNRNAYYNVASVTRVGAGTYTIVFSSPFADTNYALSISAGTAANGNIWSMYESSYAPRTTSQVTIAVNTSGTAFDPTFMSVIVFR